jgi:hypothetical protein
MSVWAFQKLTDMKWGVIPIQYRRVDCGSQPSNKAWLDYNQMFPGEFPPKSQANSRGNFDWYKYFPNGGYMNFKAGDGSDKVSVEEYLRRARGYSSSSSRSSSSSSNSGGSSSSSSSSSSSGSSSSSSSSSGGGGWSGWGGWRSFGGFFG